MVRFLRLVGFLAVGGGSSLYYYGASKDPKAQSDLWPFKTSIIKALSRSQSLPVISTPWNDEWDKTHGRNVTDAPDGDKPKGQSKHTRHLFLIRHGQYVFSNKDENCKLTQLGIEQAKLTGKRLKEMDLPYNRLIHSTMTRAIETAEEILFYFPGLPAEPCDLLREGAPIPPEPPLPSYNPSPEVFWRDGSRIESAFQHYFYRAPADQTKDTYEILVCHANVIRYFLCRSLQFPPEAWLRFSLDHASITWISIRPNGRVAIRFVGSSGHLPQEKISLS